jgi:hypothetical protein
MPQSLEEADRLSEGQRQQVAETMLGAILELQTAKANEAEAIDKRIEAEIKATSKAPDGYVFRVTGLEDGAMMEIWDSHKPDPTRIKLPKGRVVHAPEIASGFQGEVYDSATSTYLRWDSDTSDRLSEYVVSHKLTQILDPSAITIEVVSIENVLAEHAAKYNLGHTAISV